MDKYKSIKIKLYLFSFFDDFILIYPLYGLMFADNGISSAGIASLFVIWSAVAFISEIPAGAIGDRFSRRNVLITAMIIRAIGYSFWLFMPNYAGFATGFILWGVKGALTSGTLEALVYDELANKDKLDDYARVTGRMKSIGATGDVLACFCAALLAKDGYSTVLVLSVISVLAAGFALSKIPQTRVVKELQEGSYLDTIKEGVRIIFKKPLALYLVVFMSIVAGMGAADEYMNLFLREKGFSNTAIVVLAGIIFLCGAIAGALAHRLENKKLPLNTALFLWAALLFVASSAPKFLAPALLAVYIMFFFAVEILFNAHLQKHLTDRTRATSASVGGFTAELFAVISYLIVGFGANKVDYAFSFKLIAVSIAVLATFLVLYSRKHKLIV
ncbi:MAG TPA: MFS transporter [Candidatus Saccharimonadales bacterium]|nr:MFS transporter [Candidatus Saccharimonadales bacterium]